jgi:hypothetical protein
MPLHHGHASLIMFSHTEMAMGRPHDLPYSVELWDDTDSHVEELIGLIGDYGCAGRL